MTVNVERSVYLPSELVEHVLIACAAYGDPQSISALAQTCRRFRELVYAPVDQHLWRHIFLTSFDDPRPASEIKFGTVTQVGHAGRDKLLDCFDWRTGYTERVRAASCMRRWTLEADNSEGTPEELCTILRALIAALTTAAPCVSRTDAEPVAVVSSTPPFPVSSPSFPGFPPSPSIGKAGNPQSSLNISWANLLLQSGFPSWLTKRLTSAEALRDNSWSARPEARLFHQLVCFRGFCPNIKNDLPIASSTRSRSDLWKLRTQARRLARTRVYNMHYLTPRRHWGPFLPVPVTDPAPPDPQPSSSSHPASPPQASSSTQAPPSTAEPDPNDPDEAGLEYLISLLDDGDGADDDDDEYVPAVTADDEDTDDSDRDEFTQGGNDIVFFRALLSSVHDGPVPEQKDMRVDWEWLAAARIVVEANLRESIGEDDDYEQQTTDPEVLRGLFSLEGLRPLSAPGLPTGVKGDWAGVEGAWR